MATRQSGGVCGHQDCEQRIASWFKLCGPHNKSKEDGEIDECPNCGQYKDVNYPLCRNCNAASKDRSVKRRGKYEPESNPKWEAADEEGDNFFVYILKLDGGKFYAGHTRELRERLSEHRDGKALSTAGKNPRLVWFEIRDTRKEAADGEAYLKEIIEKNEREVRRMVTEFLDLIREVDTGGDRDSAPPSKSPPPSGGNASSSGYRPRRYGGRR